MSIVLTVEQREQTGSDSYNITDSDIKSIGLCASMKTELLYDHYNTEQMTIEELKILIWRYFPSYWNNRRICSANGGLPPMLKCKQYYGTLKLAA